MLAYLDALLDALSVRDTAGVERLLTHPLARILPEAARHEAQALAGAAGAAGDALAAPLRLMQLRHVTAELLREVPVIADATTAADPALAVEDPRAHRRIVPAPTRRSTRQVQMELPLSA